MVMEWASLIFCFDFHFLSFLKNELAQLLPVIMWRPIKKLIKLSSKLIFSSLNFQYFLSCLWPSMVKMWSLWTCKNANNKMIMLTS